MSGTEELAKGEFAMPTPRIRCTIVEVGCDHGAGHDLQSQSSRELLPWADPFIAQLSNAIACGPPWMIPCGFCKTSRITIHGVMDRSVAIYRRRPGVPRSSRFSSLFDDSSDLPFSG